MKSRELPILFSGPMVRAIKFNSEDLCVMLRDRFPATEYALFYEVRDGTGWQASRSADALMIGLWPSRGLEVSGFEVKVSRQDWLNELKNPAKADAIAGYCDRWWLVVADEKIVQPGELPPTWGMLAPKGGGLRVVREADKLTPAPLDRLMVAAIARAAQKASPSEKEIKAAVESARKGWDAERERSEKLKGKYEREGHENLKRAVKDFEEASGVRIHSWGAIRIGEAVRTVMQRVTISEDVGRAAESIERILKTLRELEALPGLTSPIRPVERKP